MKHGYGHGSSEKTYKKNMSKPTGYKKTKDTVKEIGSFPTKNLGTSSTMPIPKGVHDNALGEAGQAQQSGLNAATRKGRHMNIGSRVTSI